MDIINSTPKQWYENESHFAELLKDEKTWNKIPLLNANEVYNLKDLSLVRFRGMIQDQHGPEFYLEKYEVINEETKEVTTQLGKYVDIASCKDHETISSDGPNMVRGERQTYVVISIPAVNSWIHKIEEDQFKIPENTTSVPNSQTKRPVEEMETDSQPDSNKKHCPESVKPQSTNTVSPEHLLNFPIPDSTSKVCHLKIYQNFDSLKLNSVCEFVGFLSVNPALATCDDEDMNDTEFQVHNPPPSLIPRIHCVSFKRLEHSNPLISEEKMASERMQVVKKELMILLTQLMCGDELAAEYLIYHLISEVYMRRDLMALGKFTLNISNVPKFENLDYVREIYKFIELLVTKSHYLPMTLENMNELTFIPKKDYDSNRLTSSILQLSPNTHLVIDETKLSAGKLNEAGVAGVQALSNAIKSQKTTYDFTYYQIEFDCDIPFLIMSEGKSMLPSDFHVILEPDELHLSTFNEILPAARHFLKPELLDDVRIYLTSARLVQYEINDSIQELVQKEFVTMRQNSNVTGDDLHNLLVLARLVCISQGKNILDEECWKAACDLEKNRRGRLSDR